MTTERECLDALQRAAEELGESPTKAQYEQLGLTPASATIIRTFGRWNEAKERAGLATSQSTGSRVKPRPDHVELPKEVSWEELTVDQRWHYRNVEWNTERSLKRRDLHRAWANAIQRKCGGCARCHETNPACLDFHHVDKAEKEMAVGKMISFGYARNRIKNEIEKCIVLCANCHRKEHHDPPLYDSS